MVLAVKKKNIVGHLPKYLQVAKPNFYSYIWETKIKFENVNPTCY